MNTILSDGNLADYCSVAGALQCIDCQYAVNVFIHERKVIYGITYQSSSTSTRFNPYVLWLHTVLLFIIMLTKAARVDARCSRLVFVPKAWQPLVHIFDAILSTKSV